MKSIVNASVLASLLAASSVATAEFTWNDFTFSGNATIGTDYVFRGFSQTNEEPTIQGGFDVGHATGFYAGVWASNVEFNENAGVAPADAVNEATVEIDYYFGYANSLANLGLEYDIGGIYYSYPGASDSLDYDYWEIMGALSYSFGEYFNATPTLNGAIYYSPEFFGNVGSAINYDIGMDIALPYNASFGGAVGFQTFDKLDDYTHWKVYGGYSVFGFDMELSYQNTDVTDPLANGRWVFTGSRSF
jgi:uncharacterized protein (TIGR02001 family)